MYITKKTKKKKTANEAQIYAPPALLPATAIAAEPERSLQKVLQLELIQTHCAMDN